MYFLSRFIIKCTSDRQSVEIFLSKVHNCELFFNRLLRGIWFDLENIPIDFEIIDGENSFVVTTEFIVRNKFIKCNLAVNNFV